MASKTPERGIRLELFFNSLNIKRKAFAEKVNIQYGVLSQIVNGHVTLTANLVDRIVQVYPNLNPDWVLRGNGEMLLNSNPMTSVAESRSDYGPKAITLDSLTDVIRNLQDQVDGLERGNRELFSMMRDMAEQIAQLKAANQKTDPET